MCIGKYLNQIHADKNKEVIIYGGYPRGGKSLLFKIFHNRHRLKEGKFPEGFITINTSNMGTILKSFKI